MNASRRPCIPFCIALACALIAPMPASAALPKLPADPNLASMRMSALATLYELDLSPQQIQALKAAAAPAASLQKRRPAKPNPDLSRAFQDFQGAIAAGADDDAIAKAHNHITELATDADLDDTVTPTDAATAAAPAILRSLKASQLAAFLAVHADEVNDPLELLQAALESVRDLKANDAEKKDADTPAQISSLTTATAADVAYLVCGTDQTRAKALASQVADWFTRNAAVSEAEFDAGSTLRNQAAEKLIGTPDPMDVLSRWLDLRLAELLANPELDGATEVFSSRPK